MWHRAYGVVAGILAVLAAVMLGMIVNEADDPPTKILVPPPGELPPEKPPTSVADLGAIQPPSSVAGEGQASKALGSPKQPAVTTTTTSAKRTNPPASSRGGSGPAIVCPDVAGALPAVPAGAQAEVNRELGNLENQIADANRRLVASQGTSDPDFVRNAILGPLASQRVASLDRIAIAIGRFGPRPSGLERLAPCSVR